MPSISIVGGSGYVGGEALRLLLAHPQFELKQVTSESNAGKFVHFTHPNLRGITQLKFSSIRELEPVDVLVLALPHGKSPEYIDQMLGLAPLVYDLAADFRLTDPALYEKYYAHPHPRPDLLNEFVYGVPELHRERIRNASLLSGAGCIATSTITSLKPLFEAGVVLDNRVFVDAKVGSSAAGAAASPASHHPERAGCLRSFKATGHRHTAEIQEQLDNGSKPEIHLSATATDSVRGILTTAQLMLKTKMSELDIRSLYRERYGNEPFVRIVKEKRGIFRYPEPKLVVGTNFADVGFELDEETSRLVVLGAIDNLTKGSAGNMVQSLNIRFGFPERTGLEFAGLHPA